MICSSCSSDNPRTSVECISCGNKLNVVRCRCGFLNSLMDSYCGSCGKQLMKTSSTSRSQRFETNANTIPNFTEQELMRIIEIQQQHTDAGGASNTVSQSDIDKIFD